MEDFMSGSFVELTSCQSHHVLIRPSWLVRDLIDSLSVVDDIVHSLMDSQSQVWLDCICLQPPFEHWVCQISRLTTALITIHLFQFYRKMSWYVTICFTQPTIFCSTPWTLYLFEWHNWYDCACFLFGRRMWITQDNTKWTSHGEIDMLLWITIQVLVCDRHFYSPTTCLLITRSSSSYLSRRVIGTHPCLWQRYTHLIWQCWF